MTRKKNLKGRVKLELTWKLDFSLSCNCFIRLVLMSFISNDSHFPNDRWHQSSADYYGPSSPVCETIPDPDDKLCYPFPPLKCPWEPNFAKLTWESAKPARGTFFIRFCGCFQRWWRIFQSRYIPGLKIVSARNFVGISICIILNGIKLIWKRCHSEMAQISSSFCRRRFDDTIGKGKTREKRGILNWKWWF